MTRDDFILIHNRVNPEDDESFSRAAEAVLDARQSPLKFSELPQVGTRKEQALAVLSTLFYGLLNQGEMVGAALLAWGNERFNPEPQEVQRIWKALQNHNKNLIIGAGDLGKSFNMVIFALLDWVTDPKFTNSKFISVTESHMQANIWSTLVEFHRTSIIPLPGVVSAKYIAMDPNNKQAAIGGVVIPQSDDGKARLQGFHPLPRGSTHPIFGPLSRVRVYIDEGEKVSPGLWQGVDNMLLGETEYGSVKATAVTNPEDKETPFGQRAEPKDGWDSVDIETSFEWDTKLGWRLTRLDAKQSENVKQGREVFHGLQTHQGFANLVALGASHPRYATMGRGWWPEQTAEYKIFQSYLASTMRGTFHWIGQQHNLASFDGAFADGGDRPILTTGVYGLTDGYTDLSGKEQIFQTPRWAGQIEQQFAVDKSDIITMGDNLIEILKNLHVSPEWFIMDQTGNSWGIYSYLRVKYGDILGIHWGSGATETKILSEDAVTADKQYFLITSEMWFAYARWVEFHYLKVLPSMASSELVEELTGRRYKPLRLLSKVEEKSEYKSRTGGKSPDLADSAIQFCHLCRMRGQDRPAMVPPKPPPPPKSEWEKYFRPDKNLAPQSEKPYEWVDV